ncbi:carboxypeptidase-like regulatory domain-containing protein [Natronomonas marina]|uniref:carboxypeptidase-like regulatory domain-containing protein n=1 Tax=Natronomonas marina TaxID=2961939 RepID=UPI0020C9E49C|nr:carboxypeptidase-like regulatory domain-containing protein [Natronomonas marina]
MSDDAQKAAASRYADDDCVVQNDGLRGAVDDWRVGDLDTSVLRDVVDYWRTGATVFENPPAAPGSADATGNADFVEVSWAEVDAATSYDLYWSTSQDVSPDTGTRIADVGTPFAHAGVETGTTYYYVVTARNCAGESGASPTAEGTVPEPPTLEPDEPEGTTQTTVADRAEALYTGDDPVQTGVEAGAIDPGRVAIVSGTVTDREGDPVGNATVRVSGRPELGRTLSRADGTFDMAVNGGGTVIFRFERTGFLPLQRQIPVGSNAHRKGTAVSLLRETAESTTVETDSDDGQVATSQPVSDGDGDRQAAVFVPPNTSAMDTDDGTAPEELEIRATEYTVGENGPEAMPDELPNRVGYTYAVELTARNPDSSDGSTSSQTAFIDTESRGDVEFDQPVYEYERNFLDFPVGQRVPMGFYDEDAAAWEGGDDGRIIEILDTSGGSASIDVDGSGDPADQSQLDELGVTDEELAMLATQYEAGDQLWRTPVPHFSPWDCNWPFNPPADSVPPLPDFEIEDVNIDDGTTPPEPPSTPEEPPEEDEEDDDCPK